MQRKIAVFSDTDDYIDLTWDVEYAHFMTWAASVMLTGPAPSICFSINTAATTRVERSSRAFGIVTVFRAEVEARLLGIALSPSPLQLLTAGTGQLTALGRYSDGEIDVDVTADATYSSDDESIATVNSSGLVTAVAVGVTTIFAVLDGRRASARVEVSAP